MDNNVIELCKAVLPAGVEMGVTTNQRIGVLRDTGTELDLGHKPPRLVAVSSIKWEGNTACCAALSYTYNKGWTGVKAIVSVSQKGRARALGKEEAIKFYDILINHTPYGQCIVCKDTEYAYEFGLIIDPDYPANLIAGTLMAQRLAWEYINVAKSAIHYASLGVNKALAFLLGHTFSKTGSSVGNSGHCCLNSSFISKSFIKNFMLWQGQPDELFSVRKYYLFNVHNTWQCKAGIFDGNYMDTACEGSHISSALHDYAKNTATKCAIPNPFAKSFKLEAQACSDKTIVAYFEEHLEEILGANYE